MFFQWESCLDPFPQCSEAVSVMIRENDCNFQWNHHTAKLHMWKWLKLTHSKIRRWWKFEVILAVESDNFITGKCIPNFPNGQKEFENTIW